MSATKTPRKLLICCEGKQTEPQYFIVVTELYRVAQRVSVRIVGDKGQHKALIDSAVAERLDQFRRYKLDLEDIETWAVCDKDQMSSGLAELEAYSETKNVRLAFSDPKFEIFLLQHFKKSSTLLDGRKLDAELSKLLKQMGIVAGYKKTNLSGFKGLFDKDPGLLKQALKNCGRIEDKAKSPYTTTHRLLERIMQLAP